MVGTIGFTATGWRASCNSSWSSFLEGVGLVLNGEGTTHPCIAAKLSSSLGNACLAEMMSDVVIGGVVIGGVVIGGVVIGGVVIGGVVIGNVVIGGVAGSCLGCDNTGGCVPCHSE